MWPWKKIKEIKEGTTRVVNLENGWWVPQVHSKSHPFGPVWLGIDTTFEIWPSPEQQYRKCKTDSYTEAVARAKAYEALVSEE